MGRPSHKLAAKREDATNHMQSWERPKRRNKHETTAPNNQRQQAAFANAWNKPTTQGTDTLKTREGEPQTINKPKGPKPINSDIQLVQDRNCVQERKLSEAILVRTTTRPQTSLLPLRNLATLTDKFKELKHPNPKVQVGKASHANPP